MHFYKSRRSATRAQYRLLNRFKFLGIGASVIVAHHPSLGFYLNIVMV